MASHIRLSIPVVLLLAACGGSDDSASANVSGLALPSDLEVVSVDENTAGSPPPASGNNPVDDFPPDAEYFADRAQAHVWDQSLEPLQLISQILGMIAQTRAEEFVNEGAYLALVDESEEQTGTGGGQGGESRSSASQATELNPWTVLATRRNDRSPQITRCWIPMADEDFQMGGGDAHIFAKATVREAATEENPYGSFALNYVMKADADPSSQSYERGLLRSVDTVPGYMGFGHTNESLVDDRASRIEVRVSEDETSGLGRILVTEPDWQNPGNPPLNFEYQLAYDEDHFVRRLDGGAPDVLERDSYDTHTWSYGLYYADGPKAGDRVDMVGGFPIQKGNRHGFADYWGIWTEPGFELDNGDTVTGFLANGVQQNYQVVVAPGRLIKITRKTLGLASLDQERFQWWDWDAQSSTETMHMVEYRHDAQSGVGEFWSIATFDEQNQEWTGLEGTGDDVQITLQQGEWIGFWSEALGGNVDYVYPETEVSVKESQYVSGSDLFQGGGSLSLYGVADCLRAGITEQEAESGDIYLAEGTLQSPHEYVFQKSDRTLYLDTGSLARVGLVEGAEPEQGFASWGMRSGPMVDDPAALTQLNDLWEVWNLDEYYVYETGHHDWNQFRALKRNGSIVTFDPPISFLYTHSTAQDANGSAAHDGDTVMLQYGGFRNLWGIPHVEDEDTGRWYPAFSIASGTVMGPEGTEYVIKALDSELSLTVSADPPSQALLDALDVAASLTPPAISAWVNPADQDKPVVTDPPRVIDGELQD